jgi:Flp pilus assembly protein TadG
MKSSGLFLDEGKTASARLLSDTEVLLPDDVPTKTTSRVEPGAVLPTEALQQLMHGEQAQSLIEVAIFLPIFITLICYAVDFGYFFLVAGALDSASRNAVEYSIQGASSPAQTSVPSASAVSTLATQSIGLPTATSSTVSVKVCSSSVGVNSSTNTTQCSTPQTGAGSVSSTPDTDPESPTFLLNRVDVVYKVSPPVPLPASVLPSPIFHRAAEMRSIQ